MYLVLFLILWLINTLSYYVLKSTYLLPAKEVKHRSSEDKFYQRLSLLYNNLSALRALLLSLFLISFFVSVYIIFISKTKIIYYLIFWLVVFSLYIRGIAYNKRSYLLDKSVIFLASFSAKLTNYLIKPLRFLSSFYRLNNLPQTAIYSKEDLKTLLSRQLNFSDNRINIALLHHLEKLMILDNKVVKDFTLNLNELIKFKLDDHIGPKILDEMYQSHQIYFPVLNESVVVGILNIQNFKLNSQGQVGNFISENFLTILDTEPIIEAIKKWHQSDESPIIVQNINYKDIGILKIDEILSYLFIN